MISVTILTKNAEKTLEATLKSLVSFKEVIIYDTGSTDRTLEIAGQFTNVKIVQGPFIGFGPTHNEATAAAGHDWILSIDSDEVVQDSLYEEILKLPLDKKTVYEIQRCNHFGKKWIRCCAGWHPDWVKRLYHRRSTLFSHDQVHEKILTEGMKIMRLQGKINHFPYQGIADFLEKMQFYSSLFAQQNYETKDASLGKAILHGMFAFIKNYFFKKGILGGKEGFIISLYNSHVAYYKYLKLAEKKDYFR